MSVYVTKVTATKRPEGGAWGSPYRHGEAWLWAEPEGRAEFCQTVGWLGLPESAAEKTEWGWRCRVTPGMYVKLLQDRVEQREMPGAPRVS